MALFSTLLTLIVVEQLYEALKRCLHINLFYRAKFKNIESKWDPAFKQVNAPSKELKIGH
jgi:hypothetical protein